MKKLTFIIVLFASLFSLNAFSQKIEKNEIDDFTGTFKISTSTEQLFKQAKFTGYFEAKYWIQKVNESYSLGIELRLADVFSIREGDKLFFILENGDRIILNSLFSGVSDKKSGLSGAYWVVFTFYGLDDDTVEKLKTYKISKARIEYSKGYTDSEVNIKNAEKLIKSIELVENAKK